MGLCGVNTAVLLDTPVAVCCEQRMELNIQIGLVKSCLPVFNFHHIFLCTLIYFLILTFKNVSLKVKMNFCNRYFFEIT